MRSFNVMALLCLNLAIVGCNPEFTDAEKENGSVESVNSRSLDQFLTVKVQPTAKPEKYMVYFSWPRIEDSKLVRIRLDKTLAVVNPNQTDFNHEVFHDQLLTYNFEILDSASKIEKVFPKQIKIPRDFVVREGQSEFFEDTRLSVNRIFIFENKLLRTNGFKVELVANELHSEKGIIETFPENRKAGINQDGRSGGILTIKAQSAIGDLKIFMRGEHGGDGAKGDSYSDRAGSGTPAGTGSRECHCTGKECPLIAPDLVINLELDPQGRSCSCESRGANGGQGATGAKGKKGYRAGHGGSAGQLNVSIQDGREFDLQTHAIKAVAGIAGDGGDGQEGGVGGQRPNNDIQTRECGGNAGPDGSRGPQGDRGDLGNDGDTGLICVYIASENKNDCH